MFTTCESCRRATAVWKVSFPAVHPSGYIEPFVVCDECCVAPPNGNSAGDEWHIEFIGEVASR